MIKKKCNIYALLFISILFLSLIFLGSASAHTVSDNGSEARGWVYNKVHLPSAKSEKIGFYGG